VAGPARRRKTPAEPLEPSWNEVSVGCAASDFCSTRRKLPPANIEKPKLGFIQRFPRSTTLKKRYGNITDMARFQKKHFCLKRNGD